MNGSLRSKLFVWLSAAIIVTSVAIAVLSFVVRARDASEVEDAQLRQVALAIASQQRLDAVAPPCPTTTRKTPRPTWWCASWAAAA